MTCVYNNITHKIELKIPSKLSLVCKLYGDFKINSFFKFEMTQKIDRVQSSKDF